MYLNTVWNWLSSPFGLFKEKPKIDTAEWVTIDGDAASVLAELARRVGWPEPAAFDCGLSLVREIYQANKQLSDLRIQNMEGLRKVQDLDLSLGLAMEELGLSPRVKAFKIRPNTAAASDCKRIVQYLDIAGIEKLCELSIAILALGLRLKRDNELLCYESQEGAVSLGAGLPTETYVSRPLASDDMVSLDRYSHQQTQKLAAFAERQGVHFERVVEVAFEILKLLVEKKGTFCRITGSGIAPVALVDELEMKPLASEEPSSLRLKVGREQYKVLVTAAEYLEKPTAADALWVGMRYVEMACDFRTGVWSKQGFSEIKIEW